jgi:two-component system, NarL family, nitrate/nitrite response regulator NarL
MAVRREVAAMILVVDGDELHRASVTLLLRRGGYETHEVETGGEALAEAHRSRPALVVLDVRLRDGSGYEVCRQLREAFGETLPIMFVSALRTEPYDRVGGLLLGADDYLAEPFAPDELLARVRRLVTRSRDDWSALNLTKRELEILRLLAGGRNQSQISGALVIAERTVATHIQHILAKLGVHSRAQAVAVAHRRGLGADDRLTPT